MDRAQQDVDGVLHSLPDGGLGHVHALLHVAAGLELRLAELAHLGQDALEVVRGHAVAALLGHVLGQEGVGFVSHAEKGDHLQPGQFLCRIVVT